MEHCTLSIWLTNGQIGRLFCFQTESGGTSRQHFCSKKQVAQNGFQLSTNSAQGTINTGTRNSRNTCTEAKQTRSDVLRNRVLESCEFLRCTDFLFTGVKCVQRNHETSVFECRSTSLQACTVQVFLQCYGEV